MARIDAYAYYLSTYHPVRPTRYDTHKKSDLRKVYSQMVKTNKESPLFKLSNADEVAKYAIDIKENAKTIQNVVASLSDNYGDFSDSFQKKVAVSSNEEAVGVKYIGDGTEDNSLNNFNIEVKRLSSPQVNIGNYLKNDSLSIIPGSYTFDLNTNRNSYEFQFSVTPGETNLDVMKKLAGLVNRSTLGVTATIRNGNLDEGGLGTSALCLTSTQTGTGSGNGYQFNITPGVNAESMKTMELLGIHHVSEAPQNSSFTINGEEYSSQTNNFTINETFELNLNQTTPEGKSASIGFKTNNDAVADNVLSLVDAFNKILTIAQNSSEKATGEPNKLYNEMCAISKGRRESLGSIGLEVAENGSISLNKETLTEAVSEERAESTFSILARLKSAIGAKADTVSINPMSYVNRVVVAYKNPGKTFPAPYFSSVYSGMMLDRYV